jgi:hypothetical protein
MPATTQASHTPGSLDRYASLIRTLLAGLAESVIVVMLRVSVVNQVLERRSHLLTGQLIGFGCTGSID